jgi:hypothetical protein
VVKIAIPFIFSSCGKSLYFPMLWYINFTFRSKWYSFYSPHMFSYTLILNSCYGLLNYIRPR